MKKSNDAILSIARSPILWGLLVTAGFYSLIFGGLIEHPLLSRYFASHPVEFVATGMFFVGLAMLAIRGLDVLAQYPLLGHNLLGTVGEDRDAVQSADLLLERLEHLLEVPFDYADLRDASERFEREVAAALGTNSEIEDYVRQLEEAYDSGDESKPMNEISTGEVLRDVEDLLRQERRDDDEPGPAGPAR